MKNNKALISILFIVMICIGIQIGYAYLGANLNINGTGTIANAEWDIHFAHPVVQDGSVTTVTQSPTINASGDTLSYNITLNNPGDYYEFTVDVVNDGSIDGEIETLETTVNGNPISALPDYLSYSVKYLDETEIESGYLLPAGGMDIYKVRIEFKKDISAGQLPQENQEISLTLSNEFKQATSSARRKNLTTNLYAYNSNALKNGDYYLKIRDYYSNYESALDATESPIMIKYIIRDGNINDIRIVLVNNDIEYELKYGSSSSAEWSRGAIQAALGQMPDYLACGPYYYLEKDRYTFFVNGYGEWVYLKNNVTGKGCYADNNGAYCGVLPSMSVCTN